MVFDAAVCFSAGIEYFWNNDVKDSVTKIGFTVQAVQAGVPMAVNDDGASFPSGGGALFS